MGLFTKDIKTLNDLFVHQLQDIYYAEKQLVKALHEERATDLKSTRLAESRINLLTGAEESQKAARQISRGVFCWAASFGPKCADRRTLRAPARSQFSAPRSPASRGSSFLS